MSLGTYSESGSGSDSGSDSGSEGDELDVAFHDIQHIQYDIDALWFWIGLITRHLFPDGLVSSGFTV